MLKQHGEKTASGKWSSPSAERNKGPILDVLARVLPRRGLVLEIASGTGQHVVHFAKALPGLTWQPSDPDAELRESIALRAREEQVANAQFDRDLRSRDPEWGLRDLEAVGDVAGRTGFVLAETVEMPANNFSLVFKRK